MHDVGQLPTAGLHKPKERQDMKVELSKEIQDKVEAGKLKSSELVGFLIGYGFDSSKSLNESSLSDLSIDKKKVVGAKFDRFSGYIHINLA